MGLANTTSEDYATAIGRSNTASNFGVAIGYNNTAKTESSVAMGNGSQASAGGVALGQGAVAKAIGAFSAGESITADAPGTTALGRGGKATANGATTVGLSNISSGEASFTAGWNNEAINSYSTAIGTHSVASGYASLAVGAYATAAGSRSAAIGTQITASADNQVVIGKYNQEDLNALFIVGNGNNSSVTGITESNAFSINTKGEALAGINNESFEIVLTNDSNEPTIIQGPFIYPAYVGTFRCYASSHAHQSIENHWACRLYFDKDSSYNDTFSEELPNTNYVSNIFDYNKYMISITPDYTSMGTKTDLQTFLNCNFVPLYNGDVMPLNGEYQD